LASDWLKASASLFLRLLDLDGAVLPASMSLQLEDGLLGNS
jgi:hypothetical protein